MTLRDYCYTHKGEVEVWDKYIDIANPYYNQDGFCYAYTEDEYFLFWLERWILSLPAEEIRNKVVSVDVFSFVRERWDSIVEKMKQDNDYDSFLERWGDDIDDDEAVAEYVEDIFTTLSQGYEDMAHSICFHFLYEDGSLDKQIAEEIEDRIDYDDIQIVEVDRDNIDLLHLDHVNLQSVDLSQGTGNVVKRFVYVPALDIVVTYIDM